MTLPALLLLAVCTTADPAPPNFIMILTDDISQEDLGCYGNPTVKTPNLDRMAEAGVRFANAYLSCSSCSPSRCSLITARYPHNTGACELHTELPPGHKLFPKALKDAGYYTVLSGKHHMGPNVDTAFDHISAGRPPGKQGDWVEILRERPADKPFFFWFASGDAHRKWESTDDAPKYDPSTVTVPRYLADGPRTRQDLADYYHEVSRTDAFAGRLVDELKSQGIENNTYVIYLSDNGRPFPRCKTRLYDSGIKSPLIIYAPGILGHAVSQSLISVNLDLGPTILQLAGLPVPVEMQGVSFVDVLHDPTATTRDYVFAEQNWHVMQAHQRMVRMGNMVYIRNAYPNLQAMCVEASPKFPAGNELWQLHEAGKLKADQSDIFLVPRPSEELYDLANDPDQLHNLATDPSRTSQRQALRRLLDQWTDETRDSIPTDPTQDRQDAQGNRNPNWHHRIQPGIERGSLQSNAKGPLRRS